MTIIPSEAGPANIYKLMVGAIVPRPIAFVSTVSRAGSSQSCAIQFLHGCKRESSRRVFRADGAGQRRQQKDSFASPGNGRVCGEYRLGRLRGENEHLLG